MRRHIKIYNLTKRNLLMYVVFKFIWFSTKNQNGKLYQYENQRNFISAHSNRFYFLIGTFTGSFFCLFFYSYSYTHLTLNKFSTFSLQLLSCSLSVSFFDTFPLFVIYNKHAIHTSFSCTSVFYDRLIFQAYNIECVILNIIQFSPLLLCVCVSLNLYYICNSEHIYCHYNFDCNSQSITPLKLLPIYITTTIIIPPTHTWLIIFNICMNRIFYVCVSYNIRFLVSLQKIYDIFLCKCMYGYIEDILCAKQINPSNAV